MISKLKVDSGKTLTRLIESGRCRAVEAHEYADELRRLVVKVVDTEVSARQSRVFKTLADETRLKILRLLETREMCVCEIMVALELTQPTASHHLGLLDKTGLVRARKEGKWVFYRIANPELGESLRKLNFM